MRCMNGTARTRRIFFLYEDMEPETKRRALRSLRVAFKDIHDHRTMLHNRAEILHDKRRTCESCELDFGTSQSYLLHVTMWISTHDPDAQTDGATITSAHLPSPIGDKTKRRRRRSMPPSSGKREDLRFMKTYQHPSDRPTRTTTLRGSL